MTNTELAWLAGLLEGEGCFTHSHGETHIGVVIELAMIDQDIVNRAAELMGVKSRIKQPPSWKLKGFQPQWRACLYGDRAVDLMIRLFPLMGNRRQLRINELLHRRGRSTL